MNLSVDQDTKLFNQNNDAIYQNIASKLTSEKTSDSSVAQSQETQTAEAPTPSSPESPKVDTAKAETTEDSTKEVVAPVAESQNEKAESKIAAPKETAPTKLSAEQEAHVKYLKGEDATESTVKKVDGVKDIELPADVKAKLAEYESTFNDPMIKAIAEWRKTGASDINEFIKSAGLVSANNLSMEDLYTNEARNLGFDGEELLDVVEEKMSSFQSLPKLDQKKIEKELRQKALANQDERLKSFTIESGVNSEEINRVNTVAIQSIEGKVSKLANTNFKGLLITDELSKTIKETAPLYALPIYNESNKIVGYNTDEAIEIAIWKAADNGRKILKANYEMGETAGFDRAMAERTRVSSNHTSTTITPSSQGSRSSLDSAVEQVSKEKSGIVSLSGGTRKP